MKLLLEALSKAQAEIKNPIKDASNPHFKSNYVTLDGVLLAIKAVAGKYGLSYPSCTVEKDNKLYLHTKLCHTSGESIEDIMPLFLPKNDMQKLGSAITYARRYSLQNLFGITGENDDDASKATMQDQRVNNNNYYKSNNYEKSNNAKINNNSSNIQNNKQRECDKQQSFAQPSSEEQKLNAYANKIISIINEITEENKQRKDYISDRFKIKTKADIKSLGIEGMTDLANKLKIITPDQIDFDLM
jgi:hypothetical protein